MDELEASGSHRQTDAPTIALAGWAGGEYTWDFYLWFWVICFWAFISEGWSDWKISWSDFVLFEGASVPRAGWLADQRAGRTLFLVERYGVSRCSMGVLCNGVQERGHTDGWKWGHGFIGDTYHF